MIRAALLAALPLALAGNVCTWQDQGTTPDLILAVQCLNATHCFASGSSQSTGPVALFATNDAGKTWGGNPVPEGLMPLALAVNEPSILVGGLFEQYVSRDQGKTWKSVDSFQSQCARAENGNFYVVGAPLSGNGGVAVSTDGGSTFKHMEAAPALKTSARYGAFPSNKRMYISAGTWPENDDDAQSSLAGKRSHPRVGNTTGTWQGQIVSSDDGGATWTSDFWTTDFYFNEMDCESEDLCCASGEADSSAVPGVRIMCTTDGKNWNQTFFSNNPGDSLMNLQSLGNGKWIASGTFANSQSAGPAFLISTDGAKTWATETPSEGEVAVIAMSCANADTCLALGVNQFNSETVLLGSC